MRLASSLVLAVLLASCADPPPPPPYAVALAVESDPGEAVEGAIVTRGTRTVATTTVDGKATLSLRGQEGDVVDLTVKCPEALTSPPKPIAIRLARITDGKTPLYRVTCPKTMRRVVVAVRADNGPNLPVRYLDRVVARTDGSGAAHFALEVAPGSELLVTLDTTEKGGEKLKPQSPSKPFRVGNVDEVLVYEQAFQVEKKKMVRRSAPVAPVCLTCRR